MPITPDRGPLPRNVLLELASVLGLHDGVIMVGGQALALWAERYQALCPELAARGPLSSEDLDYFGPRSAAETLASAIGGTVHLPDADDHTPNTAVVTATIGGTRVQIDFLWSLAGVQEADLKRQALELGVPSEGAEPEAITVPIMHPLQPHRQCRDAAPA